MSTHNPNQPAGSAEAPEVAPIAAQTENITAAESTNVVDDDAEMSMEDFGAILEQHERQSHSEVSEGEVVKGTVEKITDQSVIINIGFKSEGIVPLEEFKVGDQITVKPGDEVDVFVKQLENHEGYVELSRADAVRMQTWDQIESA